MTGAGARRADDAGFITVWLMVVPLLVLTVAGFSVDLWAAMAARAQIAAIADDAAVAGSTGLSEVELRDGLTVLDVPLAHARALNAVDAHPESGSVTGREVAVVGNTVVVTVSGSYRPILLGAFASGPLRVQVTGAATAGLGP